MTAEDRSIAAATDLARLVETGVLKGRELRAAERSMRHLRDPLRLLIFGTDTQMAVSLMNLVLGERIVPHIIRGVQIQFIFSEETFAELEFRDGEKKSISITQFSEMLNENPSKIKIGTNLPVLNKISILMLANADAHKLSTEAGRMTDRSDFMVWLAGDLPGPVRETWTHLPQNLKDHSYLVHDTPELPADWDVLASDFVDILRVDAEAALTAKASKGGANKDAFRAAGGMDFVRVVKSEISMLEKSALDAADVLLLRHASVLEQQITDPIDEILETDAPDVATRPFSEPLVPETVEPQIATAPTDQTAPEEYVQMPSKALRSLRLTSQQLAERMGSHRPMSTVATRLRSVPASKVKKTSRVVSKPSPLARSAEGAVPKRPLGADMATSRRKKSRPNATPWSLGL
jgi:hypothetical protein